MIMKILSKILLLTIICLHTAKANHTLNPKYENLFNDFVLDNDNIEFQKNQNIEPPINFDFNKIQRIYLYLLENKDLLLK